MLLVYEILRWPTLSKISIIRQGELKMLINEENSYETLVSATPEELTVKWMNFHLNRAHSPFTVSLFEKSMTVSLA